MKFAGHVARTWKKRNVCTVLVGETERKKPLGRPSRRWHYNSKLVVTETGRKDANLLNVAQKISKSQAVANVVRDGLDPEISGNFLNR
jgi:hypothetical protein